MKALIDHGTSGSTLIRLYLVKDIQIQLKTFSRIAFGGMVKLLEGVGSRIISKRLWRPSSTSSYAIIFSSNSCLKWSENVCQKATYFCSIDGELRRVSIKISKHKRNRYRILYLDKAFII